VRLRKPAAAPPYRPGRQEAGGYGTDSPSGRLPGMVEDAAQTRARISAALKDRNTRVASLIFEGIHRSLDLIETQPPAIILAMKDCIRQLEKDEPAGQARQDVRNAILAFLDWALEEAEVRETQLNLLLAGISPPPDD
jgi:hypothetical protein